MESFYVAIPLIIFFLFLVVSERIRRWRWQRRAKMLEAILQDLAQPPQRRSSGKGSLLSLLVLSGVVALFIITLIQR